MLNVVCSDAPVVSVTSSNVSLSADVPLTVIENSTLTLLCLVDAYPAVDSVTWYKDAAVAGLWTQNLFVFTKPNSFICYSFSECFSYCGLTPVDCAIFHLNRLQILLIGTQLMVRGLLLTI